MKTLFQFRLSLIGYLVIAAVSGTIGTLAYQDFTKPVGSLVFPSRISIEPS